MRVFILINKKIKEYERRVLEPFFSSSNIGICGALIDNRPPESAFRRFKKHLKKGRGWYTVIMAFQTLCQSLFRTADLEDATRYLSENGITYSKSEEPYSDETAKKILEFNPDILFLVSGFGIIREPLLSLCQHGVISYHHGDMRKYRGQPNCFWELYNGESEMGVTVQVLNKGLDCGQPIIEKKIPIHKNDTVTTLRRRAFAESADMAYTACTLLQDANFKPVTITEYGKVYTIPNLRQWIKLECRTII